MSDALTMSVSDRIFMGKSFNIGHLQMEEVGIMQPLALERSTTALRQPLPGQLAIINPCQKRPLMESEENIIGKPTKTITECFRLLVRHRNGLVDLMTTASL